MKEIASKISDVSSILRSTYLPRLFYDLMVLSVRITLAMICATFRAVVPRRAKNLIGETVLITGAGHGIGRELAVQLGSLGCIVICWDINADDLHSTMSKISENGGEVYGFIVDVSKRLEVEQVESLMRKKDLPKVSILINNAAILKHKPFLCQHPGYIQKVFDVNVLSHFWTIRAFLPSMIMDGRGHIICICSMCGIYGVSEKVAYCSSKFAVRGLMEALHEELRMDPKNRNINLTTIYPFYVDTGLAKDPKYRFPYIFGAVSPQYAAQEVITAIRRNYTEYSIPRCLFILNAINRIVPEGVMRLILDFLADVEGKQQEKHVF